MLQKEQDGAGKGGRRSLDMHAKWGRGQKGQGQKKIFARVAIQCGRHSNPCPPCTSLFTVLITMLIDRFISSTAAFHCPPTTVFNILTLFQLCSFRPTWYTSQREATTSGCRRHISCSATPASTGQAASRTCGGGWGVQGWSALHKSGRKSALAGQTDGSLFPPGPADSGEPQGF